MYFMTDFDYDFMMKIKIIVSIQCQYVNSLNDSELQCQFIRTAGDCFDNDGLINYINLTYCTLGSPTKGVIVLFCWLLVLFIGLGVTADDL